jgi:hypothetical protein
LKRYLYDHGLPFGENLSYWIKGINSRIQGKKAGCIIIQGGLGEGKTTLSKEIGDYVNSLHGLPPINLDTATQLAQGGLDFAKKLRLCYKEKLPVIIYDEAGDFNKRGALTKFNAMLNRTFELFRVFKIMVIMCLPDFSKLDQALFDTKVPRLLLRLKNRTENQGNFYGFGLYRMNLLRAVMSKSRMKEFAYELIQPNFTGHFLDLTPAASKQLDNLTTKSKDKALETQELNLEGLLSYSQLANKLYRSIRWVKKQVMIMHIKPARVIHNCKYFDSETLNKLVEFIEVRDDRGYARKEGKE